MKGLGPLLEILAFSGKIGVSTYILFRDYNSQKATGRELPYSIALNSGNYFLKVKYSEQK